MRWPVSTLRRTITRHLTPLGGQDKRLSASTDANAPFVGAVARDDDVRRDRVLGADQRSSSRPARWLNENGEGDRAGPRASVVPPMVAPAVFRCACRAPLPSPQPCLSGVPLSDGRAILGVATSTCAPEPALAAAPPGRKAATARFGAARGGSHGYRARERSSRRSLSAARSSSSGPAPGRPRRTRATGRGTQLSSYRPFRRGAMRAASAARGGTSRVLSVRSRGTRRAAPRSRT